MSPGLLERGFIGANVTVPHKAAALALADEPSDAARAIGAANNAHLHRRGHPRRQHRRAGPDRGAAALTQGRRAVVLGRVGRRAPPSGL
ncbi:MAG: hypothetical protein U0R24_13595 [Solirubrobacterales bacterium]